MQKIVVIAVFVVSVVSVISGCAREPLTSLEPGRAPDASVGFADASDPIRHGDATADAAIGAPDALNEEDASSEEDAASIVDSGINPKWVTVTAVRSATPISGAEVAFHDELGALVALLITGADGIASHPLPRGGSVSALDRGGDEILRTISGVLPGEQLELGSFRTITDFTTVGSVSVVSQEPVSFGANFGGCGVYGGGPTPAVLDLPFACWSTSGTVDMLAIAAQFDSGVIGYFTSTDVMARGGSLAITVPSFRDDWEYAVAPIDTGGQDLFGYAQVIRDGRRYAYEEIRAHNGQLVMRFPRDFADEYSFVLAGASTASASPAVLEFRSPTATMPFIDFEAERLPGVLDVQVVHSSTTHRTSLSFATVGSSTHEYDGLIIEHVEQNMRPYWVILSDRPGTSTSTITLPELPPEWAAYLPPAHPQAAQFITLFDADEIAGYQELRTRLGLRVAGGEALELQGMIRFSGYAPFWWL